MVKHEDMGDFFYYEGSPILYILFMPFCKVWLMLNGIS